MHRTALIAAFLPVWIAGAPASSAVPQPVPGTTLVKHETRDALGRTLTFYANEPSRPAPILLMIQGSGCAAIVNAQGAGSYSTLFNLLPLAKEGRFKVVAVEKPFSRHDVQGGSAEACGQAFNEDFTAERWLAALQTALGAARRLPGVDPSRTVVLGFSEGAVMASLLAGRDRTITDAILLSGSGSTQLFDLIANAYAHCFDRSACLEQIETVARAINAKPDDASQFAWGHSFKRWHSFFAVDPAAELVRSRARLYVAFGTADTSVPALSNEIAVAKLLAAGNDVTVRRVPGGNHALVPDGASFDGLDAEYRAALDWFWKSR